MTTTRMRTAAVSSSGTASSSSRGGRIVVDLDDTMNTTRVKNDNDNDNIDDDDACSTTSSQQQLSARLSEMRRRVEEKQRHVDGILNSKRQVAAAMSIFVNDNTSDEAGSSVGQVKRERHSYSSSTTSCEQTTLGTTSPPSSLYPTASSSHSIHSSSSNSSSNAGEIEWATTAFLSSSPPPSPPPLDAADEAAAADTPRRSSKNSSNSDRVATRNCYNRPQTSARNVCSSAGENTMTAPDVRVVVSTTTTATRSSSNTTNTKSAPPPSSTHSPGDNVVLCCSTASAASLDKNIDDDDVISTQHVRSSLTVPTGDDDEEDNHNHNNQQQQQQQQHIGQVGKSNRKSLLAGCFCGGNNSKQRVVPEYDEHLGEGRQYWRDIILGVNDGLVSTFLLIAGVTGANLSSNDILLTALSGTVAGAISMAAGEYVATKTQREVMDGEIALERIHIAKNRDFELLELKEAFGIIGISEEDNSEEVVNLRRHLMDYYAKNDEAHVKVHAVLELGVVEEEKRSPLIAGGVALFLFFFGAMPSVIPFLCISDIETAFIAAAICTTTGLLLVGAIKTWATRGNLWLASMENLLIAAGGGGIAYGVGVGFEKLVNG